MLKITLGAARKNAGLTQKDVARELKISNKTVCNWENYTSSPNMAQAERLSILYNIPIDNISFLRNTSL